MAGEWYLVNAIMDKSFTCGKFDYQVTKDAHVIQFSGKMEDGTPFKGESFAQPMFGKPEKGANMLAVWKKESGNYTGKYKFNTVQQTYKFFSGIFKQSIAVTDYENYAVFIGCRNIFDETTKSFNRHIKAGILSRKPTLPVETIQVLKNVISGYDIDVSTMKSIEHTSC